MHKIPLYPYLHLISHFGLLSLISTVDPSQAYLLKSSHCIISFGISAHDQYPDEGKIP